MASFVEQATLKVNDQSSAQIRKINAELKKLFATAKSLKSIKINISVTDRGLAKAAADAKQLTTALRALKAVAGSIRINVSAPGLSKAHQQIRQLQQAAAKPINVNVNTRRGAGAAAGQPAAAQPRRGGRTPTGAFASGVTSGLGLGALTASFYALNLAGRGAAAALRGLEKAAESRARTDLMKQASLGKPAQEVFKNLPPNYKGAPMPMPKDEFDRLVLGLAADVSAPEGQTPEKAQADSIKSAGEAARYAQDEIFPRVYARTGKTIEESMKGLQNYFKAANISSRELTDNAGKLTEDAKRSIEGALIAQAANPTEFDARVYRTAVAGAKTAGFTLDREAFTWLGTQTGDAGQRVGNETFRLIKALGGTIDNKKLNNALAARGYLLNPQRDKNKNVIPNTGTAVENDLRMRNPGRWLQQIVQPRLEKAVDDEVKRRETAAKKLGKTFDRESEDEKARQQRDRIAFLEKEFPNMPQTAYNQLAQAMLSWQQFQRSQAFGMAAEDQWKAGGADAMAGNWVVQMNNFGTAVTDAAAKLGSFAAESTGAAGIFKSLTDQVRQITADPTSPESVGKITFAAAVAGPVALALGKAVTAPFTSLTNAGTQLQSAAGALQRAAAAQSRGAVAGAAGGAAGGAAAGAAGGAAAGAAASGKGRRLLGKALKAIPGVGTAIGVGEIIFEVLPENVQKGVVEAVKESFRTGGFAAYGNKPDEAARNERLRQDRQKKFDTERQTVIDKANADVKKYEERKAVIARRQAELEKESARGGGLKPQQTDEYIRKVTEASRLDQAIADKKAELAAIAAKPPTEIKPRIVPDKAAAKTFIDAIRASDIKVPTPTADPRKAGAAMPPPTQTLDLLKMSMDSAGSKVAEGAAKMDSASGAFRSVFDAAPAKIAEGGTQAGSNMSSSIISAGQTAAAAMSSAIRSAASNINVNVNVKGGADQGNINNANGNK